MVIPDFNFNSLNQELGIGSVAATEFDRFKSPLRLLSGGYSVLILFALVTSNFANSPMWLFLVVAGRSIASTTEGNTCATNCVLPFVLYACMAFMLDTLLLLTRLSLEYPAPEDFFSWSCPFNAPFAVDSNTTVYASGTSQQFLIAQGTPVQVRVDRCSRGWWAVSNVSLVAVVFLDLAATIVGWRMLSLMIAAAEGNAGPGGVGGGARNAFMGLPRESTSSLESGGQEQQRSDARRLQGHPGQERSHSGPGDFRFFQGDASRLSV